MKRKDEKKICIGCGISVSKLLDLIFCSKGFSHLFTVYFTLTSYLIKYENRYLDYQQFLKQYNEKTTNIPHINTQDLEGIPLCEATFYNILSSS